MERLLRFTLPPNTMEMTDDVKEFINIARYVDYDDGAGQGLRQNEAG